jgi:hypothetical protein
VSDAPGEGAGPSGEADAPGAADTSADADAPGRADASADADVSARADVSDGGDADARAENPDGAGVAAEGDTAAAPKADEPTRQRVERTGRRRARLTPAPDTDTSPEKPARDEPASGGTPDDDRITRERPPHW